MRNLPVKFNLLCLFMPLTITNLGLQFAFRILCLLGHMPAQLFQSFQIFLCGHHAFLHPTREEFQRAFYLLRDACMGDLNIFPQAIKLTSKIRRDRVTMTPGCSS